MKRISKNKIAAGFAGLLILFAAAIPVVNAFAKEDSFVSWESTAKKNEVNVILSLQSQEEADDIVTLQAAFQLSGESIEDVEFKFDKAITDNPEIGVHTYLYDEEQQILTVYMSGRDDRFLKKGAELKLGRMKVTSSENVMIELVEESCYVVDRFREMMPIKEMGLIEPYEMQIKEPETTPPTEEPEEPEESETPEVPGEPEVPETTKPAYDSGSSDSSDDMGSGIKGSWVSGNQNWTFQKEDGSYARSEWAMIDGRWYWFDENSVMQTGWIKVNEVWYYCSPSGERKTGWVWDKDQWYYCTTTGEMQTGWLLKDSLWYYMRPSGEMKTGWVESNQKWYYMGEDGRMLTDTVTPDGYQLDRNGIAKINK